MVGLADKLMEILELNKKRYKGADVKLVTEAILMAEASVSVKNNKEEIDANKKMMEEWMLGGNK